MSSNRLWGRSYWVWALQIAVVVGSIVVGTLDHKPIPLIAAGLVVVSQVLLALSAYAAWRKARPEN